LPPSGGSAVIFAPDAPRRARRPNLTPMIDVVFLLVVFFLLAARFGAESAFVLAVGSSGEAAWSGPPRLISVGPEGVALNGIALPEADLPAALAGLMADPADPIVLRGVGGAAVQRMLDVIGRLEAAGLRRLMLVE